MTNYFLMLIFFSPLLLFAMDNQDQAQKPITIYFQLLKHKKELLPIPHRIVNLCQTLRDPLTDLTYETKKVIFPVNASPKIIGQVLNYLDIAYHFGNESNKKKCKCLLSEYIKNSKDLIEMVNLIHYLNPCATNKTIQKRCEILSSAYEDILIDAAIATEQNTNNFYYLNPDINPKNSAQFLKESSLIADILQLYLIHNTTSDHQQPYPILNKNNHTDTVIDLLFCNDEKTIYTIKNNLPIESLSFVSQTTSTQEIKNTHLQNIPSFCVNDDGNIIVCQGKDGHLTVFLPEEQKIHTVPRAYACCASNKTIYTIDKDNRYINSYEDNNSVIHIHSYRPSPSKHITTDIHDKKLISATDKTIRIFYKIETSPFFTKDYCINIEKLLIETNIVIEKISLNQNGTFLYLIITLSDKRRADYLYSIQEDNLRKLGYLPENYVFTAIRWSPSFLLRSYTSYNPEQKTHYILSHLSTRKSCEHTTQDTYIGMTNDGSAYIKKEIKNKIPIYYTIPLIDETCNKIGLFFDNPLSFHTMLFLNKLVKNKNTVLDDYERPLYEKLPQIFKNILPIQEK